MKFILYGLLGYFLYKLVFDFIIPVSKTTKMVREKMKDMEQHQSSADKEGSKAADPGGDYIEFEEVKK
jgi:hypothetical protein